MQPTDRGLRRSLAAAFAVTARRRRGGGRTHGSVRYGCHRSVRRQRGRPHRGRRGHQHRQLSGHASADQPGPDHHQPAAGWSAVDRRPQDLLRCQPAGRQGHPAVAAALASLGTRCKLPVTLPQLMGLMQATQSQGGTVYQWFAGWRCPRRRTSGCPVSRCLRNRRARRRWRLRAPVRFRARPPATTR